MSPDDARHGTARGYSAHQRAGIPLCNPCRVARRRYIKEYNYRAGRTKAGFTRSTYLPTLGARRRVEALRVLGWPVEAIAREAGWTGGEYTLKVAISGERMKATSFLRIADAYERLSAKRGPSRFSATRAKNLGFAPPLAWDDIDSPHEKPKGVAA